AGGAGAEGGAGGAGAEGGAGGAGAEGGAGGAGAEGGAGGAGAEGGAGGAGAEGGAGGAGAEGGAGGAGAEGGAGGAGGGMEPCFGEGQFGRNGPDALPCCDGLVEVQESYPSPDGECMAEANAYTCVQCGDGVCSDFENHCNCPDDCMEMANECIAEGQPIMNFDQQCCPGLFPVECALLGADNMCFPCAELTQYCINCGDGVCAEGENLCNCPLDCEDI
ncbi:MAG: hypothetical protein VYA30_09080, partial [Myxococcota bacterium]|nr:hypothetical protein [Myxococcota bacterium]